MACFFTATFIQQLISMNKKGKSNNLIARFEAMLANNERYFFDVDEFETIAEYYFFSGDFAKTMQALDVAGELYPNASRFLLLRAQYLLDFNKLDEAAIQLDIAERLEPNNEDVVLARVHLFSRRGQHQAAIRLLKKELLKTDSPHEIHALLGQEYQAANKLELAIKHYKEALFIAPDDDLAMYNAALCFDVLNKSDEAIVFFNELIDNDPYNELAWFHIGGIYLKNKRYEEAIKAYEYALLIDSDFIAAYYEIAKVHEQTDNYKKALDMYLQSLEVEEPSGYIYYKLGHCYMHLGDNKLALRYLKKAVKDDETLDEAYLEMAAIYAVQNNFNEAFYALNKALILDPENPDFLYAALDIYEKADFPLEMINIYKRIIELEFDDVDLYIEYAELHLKLDEMDDFFEVLEEAIEKFPEEIEPHLMIAAHEIIDENISNAISHLVEAYQIDPNVYDRFREIYPELAVEPEVVLLFSSFEKYFN